MNDVKVSSDDAILNYQRECESRGYIAQQPNSEPELSKGLWLLSNTNGYLARVDAESGEVHF